MLGYRLVHDANVFRKRSFCPKCDKTIYWYDNIPVISWLFLHGQCRNCKGKISILYPIVEVFTVFCLTLLYYQVSLNYFFAYFIFFSALIITIRSDIETMLISRFTTLFLIPLGLLFSLFNFLPISIYQSISGTIFGFLLLFFINKIFLLITKKQGLGEGDAELLAFIGSFTGPMGCWFALLFGSVLGSLTGIILITLNKLKISNKIPFGPFLAIGAMIYVLFQKYLNIYLF